MCTFVEKFGTMVYELKDRDNLNDLLEEIKRKNGKKEEKNEKDEKKTLEKHYGSLIRGFDGLEYQKIARYGEWD